MNHPFKTLTTAIRLFFLRRKTTEKVFTDIYSRNTWGSKESVSGIGSSMESTSVIREQLPIIVEELKIKTFLDLPCGDYNWVRTLHLDLEQYIGGDIVEQLIIDNNKKFSNKKIKFNLINLLNDKLPDADIIFCRDCLVHLSYNDINKSIINIKKSNIKYILTTTFPNDKNIDIVTGRWRPLNLEAFPFFFPSPLKIIQENPGEKINKSIALWKVSDIKDLYL